MNTGDRIKQRRIELGLTADDLAQKIGKSRATIYRYENGDIENMPTPILEPLAKALDTTPADLMGWTSSHSGIAIERKTSNSKGQYQRFSLYADKLMKLYDQLSSSNKEKVVSYTKDFSPPSRWKKTFLPPTPVQTLCRHQKVCSTILIL